MKARLWRLSTVGGGRRSFSRRSVDDWKWRSCFAIEDANATPPDDSGMSLLRQAVAFDQAQCVARLLEAGADANEEDEYGFGLLHVASSLDVIMALYEAGLPLDGLPSEMRPNLLDLDATRPLTVPESEFRRHRSRRFGQSNPITREHCQESLSFAYLQAVAGAAGWTWSYRRLDYGADATLHWISQHEQFRFESNLLINFQLKSTTVPVFDDGFLRYDLPVANYEWLRLRVYHPRILGVLVLPSEESKWLSVTRRQLVLRHCMYWASLKGCKRTKNKRTVRVSLPSENVLSAEGLD